MRRLLPWLFFAAATSAFAGLSPEFQLGVPNYSSAPGAQAALASDGTGYFAVWEDSRAGRARIYGTRLDADGRPLDPLGIAISAGPSTAPRVFYAGSNYLVVWWTSFGVAFARVDLDGRVMDETPRTPVQAQGYFRGAIATNGDVVLAVTRGESDMIATLFDPRSDARRSIPLPRADTGEFDDDVLAAWNGTSFVIAQLFTTASNDALARISFINPDGETTSSFKTSPVMTDGAFSLAALPDRVLLASAAKKSGFNGWLFSDSGLQIGPGIQIGQTWADEPASLTTDGDTFVVAWQDWGKWQPAPWLLAVRLSRDGAAGPVANVVWNFHGGNIAIASGVPGRLLVAWADVDVVALPLSEALTPSAPESKLTLCAQAEARAALAWNGRVWLAVWKEYAEGQRLVARRFKSDGVPIDAAPFPVADVPYYAALQASVASDGLDFAIVWNLNEKILLRRLSGTGSWLDTSATLVCSNALDFTNHALGWDGSKYCLVYSRVPDSGSFGVTALSISRDGQIGAPQQISPVSLPTRDAVLARVGEQWLVAWTSERWVICEGTSPFGEGDVLGARMTFDGSVIDTAPIQFSARYADAAPCDYARQPSIASTGRTALITWSATGELRGLRFDASGLIDDSPDGNGTRILEQVDPERWLAVQTGWDGREFLVLASETDGNTGESATTLYRLAGMDALSPPREGEEVSRGMVMLDSDNHTVSLLTRPDGGAFVAYPRVASEFGGVSRLFARTINARERTRAIRR